MREAPLKLAVVAELALPHVQQAWDEVRALLDAQAAASVVAVDTAERLDFVAIEPDLVVVLGGDGAILRACRQMGHRQLPILGVNLGRLGFLADLAPAEFRKYLPEICRGEYQIVRHLMFECAIAHADGRRAVHLGLNEAVVSSAGSLHMIDVQLSIDGEPVTTYSGDGLIVSTPVGSTAHNLSAGGPILRQDLQAFVVTPICSHTLTVRPVVDSADRVYNVRVLDACPGVTLVIDGQIHLPLAPGDAIDIRRAPVTFQLAKVPGHGYYGTLHRKLGWGGQARYRNP